MGFFSPDSGFSRFMNRVCDLILLNVLFVLTSLPVVTLGASASAMYTVCFRFGTDREGGIAGPYWRAFRENFRKATVLWLLFLAFLAAGWFNTLFFLRIAGTAHFFWVASAFLLVLAVGLGCWALALQSQFENTVAGTLKNALLLGLACLPRTMVICLVQFIPFLTALLMPNFFLRWSVLLLLIWFSAAAFLHVKVMRKVFQKLAEPTGEDS